MNDWDKNNLQFILSLNEKDFEIWYECLDQDDIEYAMELLKQARTEVNMQLVSLNDEVEDLSAANKVLKQFTLKG
jgi:hypothetical protein